MIEALYIHIPFCRHICAYCDFAKVMTGSFSHEKYLNVLLSEIEDLKIPDDSLKTIYIGGGTPSELSYEELDMLLSYLHSHFPSVEEFTMECNPESLNEEKVSLMKEKGINRVSLGVQTRDESILRILNRSHNNLDVDRALSLLKEKGIDNINLDFIYGLPSSSRKTLEEDLEYVKNSGCKHVSFYSLQIEEGTLLYNQNYQGLSEDEYREQYDFIKERLKEMGYLRYEVSNFSLPGYESKHNLTYWHDLPYYAAGLGAASYIGKERRINTKSMTSYLKKEFHPKLDILTLEDEEMEYLMLNLRLVFGFSLQEFENRFHKDFLSSYQKQINKVQDYVQVKNGYFSLKEEYIYTMDSILLDLIS